MLPIKLSLFIVEAVYLDAISITSYELCFKLLYVYKSYIVVCRKVWKKLSLVVFCPKNYEFQVSHLTGISFEYWKVDVQKNVDISALEFEKFISTLCLFDVIILVI